MGLTKRQRRQKTILTLSVWANAALLLSWLMMFMVGGTSANTPLWLGLFVLIGLPVLAIFATGCAIPYATRRRTQAWVAFLLELGAPGAYGIDLLIRNGLGQQWEGIVPIADAGMMSIIIGALISIRVSLATRFELLHTPHLCRRCGYDIRFLTEPRCPECGTALDPAQHHFIEKERIQHEQADAHVKPR